MSLPINTKEEAHRSQQRYGYHVYLSRAIQEVKELSMDEQKERYQHIAGPLTIAEIAADDVSIDSNDI